MKKIMKRLDELKMGAPTLVIDNGTGAVLCLDEYRSAVKFQNNTKKPSK